jgi:hypothetical protein
MEEEMLKTVFAVVVLCLALLHFGEVAAQAQVDKQRIEIGGHITFINLEPPTFGGFARERTSDPGLGANFAYNLTRAFSLEAEVNYFPRVQDVNPFVGREFHQWPICMSADAAMAGTTADNKRARGLG